MKAESAPKGALKFGRRGSNSPKYRPICGAHRRLVAEVLVATGEQWPWFPVPARDVCQLPVGHPWPHEFESEKDDAARSAYAEESDR